MCKFGYNSLLLTGTPKEAVLVRVQVSEIDLYFGFKSLPLSRTLVIFQVRGLHRELAPHARDDGRHPRVQVVHAALITIRF